MYLVVTNGCVSNRAANMRISFEVLAIFYFSLSSFALVESSTISFRDITNDLKPNINVALNSLRDLIVLMLGPKDIASDSKIRTALDKSHSQLTIAKEKTDRYVRNYELSVSQVTGSIKNLEESVASLETSKKSFDIEIEELNKNILHLERERQRESNRLKEIEDNLARNFATLNDPLFWLRLLIPFYGPISVTVDAITLENEKDAILHLMESSNQDLQSIRNRKQNVENNLLLARSNLVKIKEKLANESSNLKKIRQEQSFIVKLGERLKVVAVFVEQYHGKVDVARFNQKGERIRMISLTNSVQDLLEFLAEQSSGEAAILVEKKVIEEMQRILVNWATRRDEDDDDYREGTSLPDDEDDENREDISLPGDEDDEYRGDIFLKSILRDRI